MTNKQNELKARLAFDMIENKSLKAKLIERAKLQALELNSDTLAREFYAIMQVGA
jgi:hypothetical protein